MSSRIERLKIVASIILIVFTVGLTAVLLYREYLGVRIMEEVKVIQANEVMTFSGSFQDSVLIEVDGIVKITFKFV